LTSCNRSSIITPRDRHPKKEVEEALKYAEAHGWAIHRRSGHAWGQGWCPAHACLFAIWSTPRNSGNHAKQIRREVIRCPHKSQTEEAP
jgi:hypothetical protein